MQTAIEQTTAPGLGEVSKRLLEIINIGEQKDHVDDMIFQLTKCSSGEIYTITLSLVKNDGDIEDLQFLLTEAVPDVIAILQRELNAKRERLMDRAKELMK